MPPPLTVVQALPSLEGGGGVERGTLEVARRLTLAGHRSIVISSAGPRTAALLAGHGRHIPWPIGKKSPLTLALAPRLRAFLERERPDILHVRSRAPAWICQLAIRRLPPARRPRLVSTFHGAYSVNRYSAVMARGERVIAVSRFIREYILRHFPADCAQERLVLIPRGIDPEAFPFGFRPDAEWLRRWRGERPGLEEQRIVTLPARLSLRKGVEDFIATIQALKKKRIPVHGLIPGKIEARKTRLLNRLRRQSARMGVAEDISFLGHRDDIREILSISDAVLSLSGKPEAFGRTVLEACSLGVPVLAYDHGGASEILDALFPQGKVRPGDREELTRKLAGLLERPARPRRRHPYLLEDMLNRTLALYEELAAESASLAATSPGKSARRSDPANPRRAPRR